MGKTPEENDDNTESEEESHKNSDEFPVYVRPELFHEDKKFNRLSYETATKICWEHKQMKERKAMKVLISLILPMSF